MGPVKEHYLFYEKAGDQFVGRTVCGLSPLSIEFAVGPPHFNITTEAERKLLTDTIEAFVGEKGKKTINKQTWYCISMLYASLVYHYDYLKSKLHSKSSLNACFIFTDVPEVLKSLVRVSYPWNKDVNSPVLTGIPPHILVLAQLDSLTRSQLTIADEVVTRIKEELDNRDIGGGYHASRLISEMNESHSKIIDSISEVKAIALSAALSPAGSEGHRDGSRSGAYHCYDGKFHRLPKGWIFPQLKLQPFIVMWLVGSVKTGVPPLKTLKACDVAHLGKRSRKTLCEMRKFAGAIEKAGRIVGLWKTDPDDKWDLKSATDLFHGIFKFFCFRGNKSLAFQRRYEALSWKTIYNHYLRNGKRLAGEVGTTGTTTTNDSTQQTLFECSTMHVKL